MPPTLPCFFALSVLCTALASHGRNDALDRLEKEGKILSLQWRRDAAGDLEFAAAGDKDASFAPLFSKGLIEGVRTCGVLGKCAPWLHNDDMLSLTDGEAHLQRLGIGTTNAALAEFVRSPLPGQLADVALLDRLVAIDLLQRRGDAAAAELAGLSAETTLAAAIRARLAKAAPTRSNLDAQTLLLPAQADLYCVIDHARLSDAHWLVALTRDTGLIASATVLGRLKNPLLNDKLIGQSESDTITELPFELVRQFGNFRFDRTCLAIDDPFGEAPKVVVASAGHFDPPAVAKGFARLGADGTDGGSTKDTAKFAWPSGTATVTGKLLTFQPTPADLRPRPEFATKLLQLGTASLRIHVPAGSRWLAALFGAADTGVLQFETAITLGDPIVYESTIQAKDAASAAQIATKATAASMNVISGQFGIAVTDDDLTSQVKGDTVLVRVTIPRARLSLEKTRRGLFEKARR